MRVVVDVTALPATVALVGDSHLTDRSAREVLKLGPRLRAAGFHVTTYAIGGLTTRAALELAPAQEPSDWTVYCFGTNDAAPWKQIPLGEFIDNYGALLRRQPAGARVVLGPPPVGAASADLGRTFQLIEQYAHAAASVAARYGAGFLPLHQLLSQDDLYEGGIHLNDAGYGKIVVALCAVLARPRGDWPSALHTG